MFVKKLLKQAQLHGLNKLDDAKYRWVWIIALLLLLAAAANIATILVLRFIEAPTYIVRKEKVRTFMEFPSVQLCPELSFPDYKIEEFFSKIKIPRNVNVTYVKEIIQQLGAFYSPDVTYKVRDLKKIEALLDYNKLDVYTAAKMLMDSCEDTLIKCRLFGYMRNCSELFKLEITQYGYCCIFNSRSLRSEILENGVHNVKPQVEYIEPFVGFQTSLMVAVNQNIQLADVDLNYKWMAVDGGQAYVDTAINGTPLSPSMEMWFAHYTEGFHIDEIALSLNLELRGCQLGNELLTLFPMYHKKYCQLECEIWHLIKKCKCVMVTHPGPPNVPICRARYLPCARRAMTQFNKDACPCPHTCDKDSDYVEISSFQLYRHAAIIDSFYADLNFSETSVVRVFIGQRNVKTKSRRSYYSYQDLFAQLGGIFNVFFGCSLISILEMLQIIKYAFTNWRERRQKQSKYLEASKQGGKKKKSKKVAFENVKNK